MTSAKEYLVLARKWRPQSFEDVVGQDHVIRTLRNAIARGRVAHAFVFSGPRGVGKTSIARILAKSLNCEAGPTAAPCQDCAHCKEITAGIALDVREIDGASNRGIDEIRELRDNVRFLPASGRYKVYIIDEVHMLTREAFNALLKTLEEPPAHVVFVFATTEAHKIPATILSRCQCFDFRRIPLREIAAALARIAEAEGIRLGPAGLAWIAEAGDGSLRDAQSILDQVISYAGPEIRDEDVEAVLGLLDRRFLLSLSEAVLARDAACCLRVLGEAYASGLDMLSLFQALLRHFRNLLFVCLAGDGDSPDIPEETLRRLRDQAATASRETLQRLLDILLAEEDNLRRSQDPRVTLEAVLVRMACLEPLVPVGEILERLEDMERRLRAGGQAGTSGGGAPRREPVAIPEETGIRDAPSQAYGAPAAGGGQDLWEAFRGFVKQHHPLLSVKLEQGLLLECAENRLRIGFPADYLFLEDILEPSQQARLQDLARRFFRAEVAVSIETVAGEAGRGNGNGASRANRIQERKREALNHPLLQNILDAFAGAEVREVISRGTPPQG